MDEDLLEEKVKYYKKKPSNTSKASEKSKHKHTYDKIIIFKYKIRAITDVDIYEAWSICSQCGKLGNCVNRKHFNMGLFKVVTLQELQQTFPTAKVVDVGEKHPYLDIKYYNE